MEKIDLRKQLKPLYSATGTPAIVEVPSLQYLMIDGQGDPNTSPEFAAAIGALYALAYTLKFSIKKSPMAIDYPVMPLQGLWWADDMSAFLQADRGAWKWTLMIVVPDIIDASTFRSALADVERKKPSPELGKIRLERFKEGRAAQLMHVGPYSTEGPNIERLHAFIAAQGGTLTGRHHEIYLSDTRRTAPEKLKTIIRQPFA